MSISALRWSFAQQLSRQIISIVVYLVLAKLLSPVDFGLVAIAAVWIAVSTLFLDSGFGTALIQKKDAGDEHYSSVFVVNICAGFFVYLLIYLGSPALSSYYKQPELIDILRVMAISVIFTAIASTKISIAQKAMNFRMLTIRDVSAVLAGGCGGILAALYGYGVWSLVLQAVTTSVILSLITWKVVAWNPNLFLVSLRSIKDLWGFSSKIFLFGLLKLLSQSVDIILIGLLLNPAAVGLYAFSTKTIIMPISSIRAAYGAYLFPRFSTIQGDTVKISFEYTDSIKRISYFVTPILLVAYFLSDDAIVNFFDKPWHSAIELIRIVTFVALMQSVIAPIGELIKAIGRPGLLVLWGGGFTAASVCAIYFGTYFQLMGVAWALLLVNMGGVAACIIISGRLIKAPLRLLFRIYTLPIIFFTVLVFIGNLIESVLVVSTFLTSVAILLLLLLLYVFALQYWDPAYLKSWCNIVRRAPR